MNRVSKILLAMLSFLLSDRASGQAIKKDFAKIPGILLQEDLQTLKDSLIAFHPGLYRYANRASLNQLFDSTISAQMRSRDTIDFYATVRYLISAIKDGHTKAILPKTQVLTLKEEVKMFPLALYFSSKKAYLTCNALGLPAGTEVLAINNTSIVSILEKLFDYIRSDGDIVTKKYWDINFGDSPFPFLYYWVYGEQLEFDIHYRLPSKSTGHKIVSPAPYSQAACIPAPILDSPSVQSTFINKDLALLKINGFVNQYAGDNFEENLQTFFSAVKEKGVEKIILDLRDNGGGQDVFGALLYAYLTTSPFAYYRSLNSTHKLFTVADYPNLAVQQPKANAFTGRLYILINGQSFSTTTEFCAIAKSNNRATFIGMETGGGYYGNTSGPSKELTLPNSKIIVRIPLYQYFMEVKPAIYSNRGIFPDYEVEQKIAEHTQGADTQYNFALKMALSD